MVRVHAGRLKLTTDPHPINLILGFFDDGCSLEFNLSFVRAGSARDQIEKSALAGAVRPYNGAELALIEIKIQIIDRFKAIKAFRDPLRGENESLTHNFRSDRRV